MPHTGRINLQGSKFHSSDRLRWVKMTVGQVEYLQDLSDWGLHISDFHISCIGFIYFRQVDGTFRQVIFKIHLPEGQVHSIWYFEAWSSELLLRGRISEQDFHVFLESLKIMKYGFIIFRSLWNLTGISAAVLLSCLKFHSAAINLKLNLTCFWEILHLMALWIIGPEDHFTKCL